MKSREKLVGIAVLAALAMNAAPAFAQVEEGRHEVHVYGGQLFGDDLTDRSISGRVPKLDDDLTYGFRYGYTVTRNFGLELSVGETATSATDLATRDIYLDLTTLDLDAVWSFNPGSPLVPYALAGVGYASADLDRPIVGTVNGQPVAIKDDNGFTLNAGAGLKYFVNDRFLVRLEARYRYLDQVVDRFDDSLNTVETTLGVGWTF
ncbi:MAG TPA: outer membrane beta-barrel domain-containing protein [Steroidobacteraceae bacterium]|jgi:outer membrane beta-barrel protein|nr:outer membrane beta-barrel domain-containing protein [Steroidobacteraceae bacterium]